jgi:hypothetical protein
MEAIGSSPWGVVPDLLHPDRKARKTGRTNNKAKNLETLDDFKRYASNIGIGWDYTGRQ